MWIFLDFFQPVPPLPTELNGTPPPVPKKYTSKQASLTWISPTLRTFLYYTYLLLHGWSYELVYKLTIIIFKSAYLNQLAYFLWKAVYIKKPFLESVVRERKRVCVWRERESVCVCGERKRAAVESLYIKYMKHVLLYILYTGWVTSCLLPCFHIYCTVLLKVPLMLMVYNKF